MPPNGDFTISARPAASLRRAPHRSAALRTISNARGVTETAMGEARPAEAIAGSIATAFAIVGREPVYVGLHSGGPRQRERDALEDLRARAPTRSRARTRTNTNTNTKYTPRGDVLVPSHTSVTRARAHVPAVPPGARSPHPDESCGSPRAASGAPRRPRRRPARSTFRVVPRVGPTHTGESVTSPTVTCAMSVQRCPRCTYMGSALPSRALTLRASLLWPAFHAPIPLTGYSSA
jgi:hypothetical protein